MRPNFIFIGPDKSGSSWLHHVLSQHPQGYVPPSKDIYFFDRYYDRGLEWYFRHFVDCPPDARAVGELSHDYLFSPLAAERIRADLPDVRLITSLREPLDRSFSQYLYMRRNAITHKPFEEAVKDHPEILSNSLYARHLEAYFALFQRNQIKTMFYDHLKAEPRSFALEIFDFLGLATLEMDFSSRVRPASQARSRLAARAAHVLAVKARNHGFGRLVGWAKRSWMQEALYKPYAMAEKPTLPADTRRRFAGYFDADIARLERLLHVDLAHWRETPALAAAS
jgi:hypothetical protein